jgi:hypothetical protein
MGARLYALRQNTELRATVVAITAVLLSWASALWLEGAAHLNLDAPLLAAVLALTLSRTQRGADWKARLTSLVVLPLIGVGAAEVGRTMLEHPNVGDTLFVAAVVLSIYLRRFGRRIAKAGTLIALPFIAILVTPLPLPPGRGMSLWAAVIALIALCWVTAVQLAAHYSGFLPDAAPGAGHPAAREARSTLRPPASTRMAIQMGLALGLAFVVGRYGFTPRWTWTVLTAFIVCSGNRGRGDVVHKSLLRIGGAACGTVAATLLAGTFGPRDDRSLVLIFLVLGLANWLRSLSYAYWAACVTAVLALLQGYVGETHLSLLLTRLEEILVGAALGVLVSWVVLPVRTESVVRRRIADPLATLTDLLNAVRQDPRPEHLGELGARFAGEVALLDQVAAPVRTHRLFLHRLPRHRLLHGVTGKRLDPDASHLADAIDAVQQCAEPVRDLLHETDRLSGLMQDRRTAGLAGLAARNVGEARRALGRRPGDGYQRPQIPPTQDRDPQAAEARARVRAALLEIDAAMATIAAVFSSPRLPEPPVPVPPPAAPVQPAAS